ncbi:roundabout homolog 2-like [Artemia franciscana]|uniref:roundabout homolog 2-like n=1 Tax=Artemia franciscana TaxID=6661 RepID=UPI0032DBB020
MIVGLSLYLLQLSALVNGQQRPVRITEHPVDTTVPRNDPVTLQCKAEGNPDPVITWFKDGETIFPNSGDSRSHRILLPGGALFFLAVTHSRRESDSGVYWCLARNSVGSARSKNATLIVAYLQSEFKAVPQSIRSIQGESITIYCDPPKGQPEPQVKWKKNGQIINFDNVPSRYWVDQFGLHIDHTETHDSGRYQCIAFNVAGSRETSSAVLTVHTKPEIIKSPQNVETISGEDAYLECLATGDPTPLISWRKDKRQIAEGKSLRIEGVTMADDGMYTCMAENSVGSVVRNATLTVFVPPIITSSEPFVRVEIGDIATLPCFVEGVPVPIVEWTKEGYFEWGIMLPDSGRDGDRIKITPEGTLVIRDIHPEDAGTYICLSVNPGGGELSRTRILLISEKPTLVPPIIARGPSNQTLPLKSEAFLFCEAYGAEVSWWKDKRNIEPDNVKFFVGKDGTLKIRDLQTSDSGDYSCKASSKGGNTYWFATLKVESPSSPEATFDRATKDPLALPGSPSKPHLVSRSSESVVISWKSGNRMGASPLLGYLVETYKADIRNASSTGQWRVIERRLASDSYTLKNLLPGNLYLVLVRAENSHGLSLPSPISDWIEITESLIDDADEGEREQTREALAGQVLRLDKVVSINATSVQVIWESSLPNVIQQQKTP